MLLEKVGKIQENVKQIEQEKADLIKNQDALKEKLKDYDQKERYLNILEE